VEKEPSPGKKKSALLWIGVVVLVTLIGVLGWQAKSLLPLPEPAPARSPIRGKVPPMPSPLPSQTSEPSNEIAQNSDPAANGIIARAGEATEPMNPDAPLPETAAVAEPIAPEPGQGTISQTQPIPDATIAQSAPQPAEPLGAGEPQPTMTENGHEEAPQPDPTVAEPQTAPAAMAPEPVASAAYTIQVGSFRTKTYADKKVATLTQKGYKPFIFEVSDANQRKWYAVRFGRFETSEKAAQFLSEFKKKENIDGIIRRFHSF
jgi:cell division protein FtsN